MVIGTLTDSKLVLKVLEREETMGSIEFFVIFSVAALNFSVVPGSVGLNQFVPNTKAAQLGLEGRRGIAALSQQPLCKFSPIVGLHTLNGIREALHAVLDEL